MKKAVLAGILGVILAGGAGTGISYMTTTNASTSAEAIATKYINALKAGEYEDAYGCVAMWGEALSYADFVKKVEDSGLANADLDTLILSENSKDDYNNTILTCTVEQLKEKNTGKETEEESEADGKDGALTFQMIQVKDEKGLFSEWRVELLNETAEKAEPFTVTVPAGAKLLLNDYLASDLGASMKATQKGDVYTFEDVAFEDYEIKVGTDLFDVYTAKIDPADKNIDATQNLVLSKNAKTILENNGKEALSELFKGAFMGSESYKTASVLKAVTTSKALIQNISNLVTLEDTQIVKAVKLDGFVPVYGEPTFTPDGSGVTMTMDLKSDGWFWISDSEASEEKTEEAADADTEDQEAASEKKSTDLQATVHTAYQFTFTYKNGTYSLTSIVQTDAEPESELSALASEEEETEEEANEEV